MSLLSKETGQHSWPVAFRTLHALPSPTRQLHPQAHADACIDYFLFPERGHIFMLINFAQTVCSPTISNPTRPLSLYSNVISFINPALNPLVRALSPVSPQHGIGFLIQHPCLDALCSCLFFPHQPSGQPS